MVDPVLGSKFRRLWCVVDTEVCQVGYTPRRTRGAEGTDVRVLMPSRRVKVLTAKVTVRGGLVLAGEGQTANPLEFGGDRKTIGKL